MRLVATRLYTRLLWFAASILVTTSLATPSWAYEPPTFDPQKSLYETGLERNDAHSVRRVLSGRGLRVWVVVADVIDEYVYDKKARSHTEDALEQTWTAWTAGGFEGSSACLMVVGLDDRRVQLKCGPAIDRDLGLHTERLANITDRAFVPAARRGDLTSGIRDTVQLLREHHDTLAAVAPYVWSANTMEQHVVQRVDGIWSPRSTSALIDPSLSLDTHIVAVVRAGSAQALAEQALADYRAVNPAKADLQAVVAYVWAADEFGVAVAPEASRWTDSTDRAVLTAMGIGRQSGPFEDRLAQMSQALDQPFTQGMLDERKGHLRPPQLGPLDPRRHLYGPSELMDQPDLEAWLASLPMAVRLHLVPALHDGELSKNPSGASWTEHIAPSADALAKTSALTNAKAAPDVVLTVWAPFDDQPMRLQADVPAGLGGFYSAQHALQAQMTDGWSPPTAPDRWRGPELQDALATAIQPMLDAHAQFERLQQRKIDRQRRGTAIGTIVMSVVFGCILLFVVVLITAPARKRKRLLLTEVQAWHTRIAVARERLTDFALDTELRDRLQEIKVRGPLTDALLERVTSELDRVELGLRGLQAHVDAVGASVERKPMGLGSAGYSRAADQLERAFDTPPGSADDPGLFQAAETSTLHPTEFVDSLQARFATARADRSRLLRAIDLAWRGDLPVHCDPVHIDGVIRQLEQEHLSVGWLVGHPINRPAALRSLRAHRRDDPVAYLNAIDQITADGAAVFARIDAVLDDIISVRVAAERAEIELRDIPPAVLTDAQDPRLPAARAREAGELLTRLTVLADDEVTLALVREREAQIDDAALAALAGWAEATKRLATLRSSVQACDNIRALKAELRAEQQRVAPLKARLADLAVSHTIKPVWDQVMALLTELADVRAALDTALQHIQARRWVDAAWWIDRTRDELTEAVQAKDHVEQTITGLIQAKDATHAIHQQLANERAKRAERLNFLHSDDDPLRAGDALLATLQTSWGDGPADWSERLEQVQAIQQSWKEAVDLRHLQVDRALRLEYESILEDALRQEQRERHGSFGQSTWASRSSSWSHTFTDSSSSGGRGGGSSW